MKRHIAVISGADVPLTTQQIIKSAWAKRFKKACPEQYDEAIAIAQDIGAVTIEQRDDHSSKGDFTWAIIPDKNPAFWLDGLSSKEKAIALCTRMQWPLKNSVSTGEQT